VVEVDPRIGTEFAGYRIETLLGRGGMAVVYRARDERLDRRVALKLLNPDLSADGRFRERFLRESKLAASIGHPSIVPVYEAGEAEGLLFVAIGYVEGTDLASLLAGEGRLEPERALEIVAQLAGALDAARWGRGLVHGGLKPSEVLVAPAADAGSGEHVFLCGFGLRRELPPGARLAEAPKQLGMIDYLAPEQIEGKPVSPRTDVYALGCLLFECLTCEPAFRGDSPEALLQAHLHKQAPSARRSCPDLPAGIDRVIRTALAKWPEERYSTCGELAAAARVALAPSREQPSEAALPPRQEQEAGEELPASAAAESPVGAPASPAQRLGKRGRKPIAAIGLVLLLAALVAGVIWLTGRDTADLSSATPAPSAAETLTEVAVPEGQGTAEPPAEPASDGSPAPVGLVAPGSRHALTVDGVPFSFRVPTPGWERFGSISINKSTVGPQGAEAIIFWTSFPDGEYADPCANLLSPRVGRSAADLAAAVSTVPGTKLVRGPSDVTVGGRAAKHVVLTVRENVGCDPGFFYTWEDLEVGALWPETRPGDTIRVWIVDVDGTRLFIEAETTGQAGSDLEQEVQQIVESIRFD
jgi:Protein kinase domain